MIRTYWEHVHPGACVRIKGGAWHVTDRSGNNFTVRSPDTLEVVGPVLLSPSRPAEVLEPTDPDYVPTAREQAAGAMLAPLSTGALAQVVEVTLAVHLGATVFMTQDGRNAIPVCHTADRWHLLVFHDLTEPLDHTATAQRVAELHATTPESKEHTHPG